MKDAMGRVLIVDDVEMNRKLLRANLRTEGFETLEAEDGAEALAILRKDRVDAVVSDILMPNMDGYRLCAEVRSAPNLRDLPFLVYSATYISPADEKLAKEAGADRYFRKPYDLSALIEAIKGLLRERRPEPTSPKHDVSAPPSLKAYDENLIRTLLERVERLAESERRYRRITKFVFRTLGRGAAAVLYSSGLEGGIEVYDHVRQVWNPGDDKGFGHSLEVYSKLSGLGEIREFRVDRHRFEIRIAVNGTFEATIHDGARAPMCHFLRGILAGVGTRLLGGLAMDCKETMCRATGSPRCEFLVQRVFVSEAQV